ncbi:YdeI/OmpD-associated family protein [Zobellia galactanivorans]|uniref:YdeI/OmpD-associated family protein n=1 Tax=Zobellia galactanivorans (strain DSM 12802 / CCUG 47099 / CIP 106680 / NCIMB 13871 / Dsij) TaxID=63186 RepID=UPI0026E3A636|nr:YdeI/OmpD-associated family protein [Zobellia galactanivorans]MDO6810462.1 YdeI/OmpD-associated family protein [Zobellia galactanivorans]
MDNEVQSFTPSNRKDWRKWLEVNHAKEDAIWLIIHKKNAPTPNINWSDAVDEALCFGWIDSVKRSIDPERYKQYFSKRKANSTWSKINKEKIVQLEKSGLLTESGLKSIEIGKQNGSWNLLDSVEKLEIPMDLEKELGLRTESKDYFLSLSKSVRKAMLQWVVLAKRPETRQKRIQEIAERASQKRKPKQF